MKLIIGIGNPGERYEGTRHNIGFHVIDEFAKRHNLQFKYESKFEAFVSNIYLAGNKAIIIKPTTYVNLSGNAVKKVMNYYNINIEDILVIYDDIHLDVGRIRIREKGGHGGHNGIRDIINHLGSRDFKRIRIGVGNNPNIDLDKHVLGRFSKQEQIKLEDSTYNSLDAIELFIAGKYFKDIMTKHNTQT